MSVKLESVGILPRSSAPTFSSADREQIEAHGLTIDDVIAQIDRLHTVAPSVDLVRPATVGDGIVVLEPATSAPLIETADSAASAGRVSKFVPASGAATRMFRDLIGALESPRRPSSTPAGREFFERLDDFPFAVELRRSSGLAGRPTSDESERRVLSTLLGDMGYADLPKGLIPFHRTDGVVRTAFEEHLLEGVRYTRAKDGACRMHFTVPPDAREAFGSALEAIRQSLERERRGTTLDVSFSIQHPATDSIAIDSAGEPFRTADGSLLFRPSGHGALLRNLQETTGDIVVLKNIDNVVPDDANAEIVRWKRVLIGYLVTVQAETGAHLRACASETPTDRDLEAAMQFAARRFARQPPVRMTTRAEKRRFVVDALDRPARICGVVRNDGEPGGAPFWVRDRDGLESVQIVESAQVGADADQAAIFRSSTHFNPVDLACGLRSWRGEAYDLSRFVDDDTAFVVRKSHEGRDLVSLERPGLWNGGMAGWNTICVEVPASTFAPVKTVFDLLRPQHQPRAVAHRVEHAEALAEDLRAAADIQRALLPSEAVVTPGIVSASVFRPSFVIGGDIFNVWPLADGTLGAFIADVSGHGVASALMTVSLTQWLASSAGLKRPGPAPSPAAVLQALNLTYPFERFEKYFSIVVVIIDPNTGRLRYSSAGHPAPFIMERDGHVRWLQAGGPIIGMGLPMPVDDGTELLAEGERLVLYTDGVTDDLSSSGERFGTAALLRVFEDGRTRPLRDVCAMVAERIVERRGDAPARDDIALLAFERAATR